MLATKQNMYKQEISLHELTNSITNNMEPSNKIPVIDFEDLPNQLTTLLKACEEWGCFRLINYHKILPLLLMQEMKTVTKSLLELPIEIKKKNTDVIMGSGYVAPNPANPLYEALGLYDMASAEAVDAFCSQLDASSHQREMIVKYAEAVHNLTTDLGSKLGEALGLQTVPFGKWTSQLRINRYEFNNDTIGQSGVQIHTDPGFLTILQDDDTVGGLEVIDKFGTFISVDPYPGTLIVNLGDIATVWSNGRFYSVKHRVICKEAAIRVSIASFVLGPENSCVEPPAEFIDSSHPLLFIPLTFKDYRKLRLTKKLQAGEALALVRTKP